MGGSVHGAGAALDVTGRGDPAAHVGRAGAGATPPSRAAERTSAAVRAATVPDSVFNHGDDVEFILDPVTLRKGRPHTIRGTDAPRGQRAMITF